MTIRVWSWRQAVLDSELPATAKLIACVLSSFMNDHGGGCYPSTREIARLASLSERAVCTHLETLAAAGWVVKRTHGFNGQGWARNEYAAAYPAECVLATGGGTERRSERAEAGSVPPQKGTERRSEKALNDVQSNSPPELSKGGARPSRRLTPPGDLTPDAFRALAAALHTPPGVDLDWELKAYRVHHAAKGTRDGVQAARKWLLKAEQFAARDAKPVNPGQKPRKAGAVSL